MTPKAQTIIRQVAVKMISFGFPAEVQVQNGAPYAVLHRAITSTIEVWLISGWPGQPHPEVYALVISKGHTPLPAWHVVDFRVGSDIYGETVPEVLHD